MGGSRGWRDTELMKEYILKIKNHAHNWENTSPIGAGSIGASVYGEIASERISYNEETIWDGDYQDTKAPGYKEGLLHIRSLFMEGKPHLAEKWAMENFEDKYFVVKSYEAAGELYVDLHHDSECENYKRNLDLMRGVLNISYDKYGKHYERESFASHPAKLVCTRISCDEKFETKIRYVRENIVSTSVEVLQDGTAVMDYVCATANSGKQFRFTAKIVSDGELFKDWYGIGVNNASKLEIFVSCVTAFRDENMETAKYLSAAAVGYDELKKEHVSDFSAIMERSDIDFRNDGVDNMSVGARLKRLTDYKDAVDREMISLYFQFGKYLLVSSSREDTYPANLQGLWCDGLESPWNADYHTNINLQMNYWPVESANISECANALFTYMNDCLLPAGRRVAKENYEVGGAVVHHVADIYQFAAAADGIWGLWPLGGAWLAYHMWEHYLYTEDKTFLKDTAYEFIRDSAVFFMDTMFEGENGEMLSGPSTSPENSYYVDVDGNKERVFLAISPTMDVEIIGGLFDLYIECEDILKLDSSLAARAADIRSKMPSLKIGKRGQLQEWIEDYEEFEPGHRHISHSFGLYPAAQITRKTPEYYAAIRKTLELRLSSGGGHTGWSRAWLICNFARLRNGKDAYKNLRALFTKSTLYNMFDNHPPFQIDGNFGGCAAIAEMVMQSHEGFISLLPAISDEMKDGSFKGLCARGNYTVSAEWNNGEITTLTVNSATKESASIELPDAQLGAVLVGSDGMEYNSCDGIYKIPCGTVITVK
ncbi:MAG: glycoside hydrolase family 95 protein [Clostridiales bacterium]|nr:glycoside hydrolase family 95 protein [Clostridiales bacterium]